MQGWPLRGRTTELGVIADVLSGARGLAGVAIIGAAGVGKTRLAREAADVALARGWAVRWLSGTHAAQSVPLGAFAQWAEGLDGHPLALVGSVIAAVTATAPDVPVVVCVDDAHRLDDLSAFVVHQLVLRGSAKVIATIRAGETIPDAVTALWKDRHLRRLDVEPLSRTESDALLEEILGGRIAPDGAARLWRLTRGNAMFMHEIVNHGRSAGRLVRDGPLWTWTGEVDLPSALIDLVELQLGEAEPPVRDVLDMVALAEPLELIHLASLADPHALEEAERRGLVTVSSAAPSDVVRVGHPLFAEVRLARAGRWRLARLRGRLARAMSAANPSTAPADPVRLALLWLDSDRPPDTDVLVRATLTAMQRMDLALGARFAEAATNAGAGPEVEVLLAQCHSLMSRGEDAERILASLMTRALPGETWTLTVLLRAANLLWSLGQPERSRAVVDEALAASLPESAHGLLAFKAVQLAVAGRPRDAVRCADSVDRERLHPLPAMMLAWAETIAHGDAGRTAKAAAAAEAGAALAATSPEVAFQGEGLAIYFADALILGGNPTRAAALAQRIAVDFHDVPGAAQTNVTALEGFAALANGNGRAAVDSLETAVGEYVRSGSTVGTEYFFGVGHVQALAMAGQVERAQHALTNIQRNPHHALQFLEPSLRLAEAWVAAALGHLSRARAIAAEAAEFACARGQYTRELACLQAAIQFGSTQHADRLAQLARLVDGPRAPLVARWAVGLADHDGAELLDVSAEFETIGDRIAAADAAAHASLAFARRGRRGAALTAAGRASSCTARSGVSTPATRAAVMPLSLSEREREIAVLVSGGMSNKEIAAAMTVSVRTVEGHVLRACRKLGVANRTELASVLHPLIDGSGVTTP